MTGLEETSLEGLGLTLLPPDGAMILRTARTMLAVSVDLDAPLVLTRPVLAIERAARAVLQRSGRVGCPTATSCSSLAQRFAP